MEIFLLLQSSHKEASLTLTNEVIVNKNANLLSITILMEKSPTVKFTDLQIVEESPAYFGTQKLTTVLT